MIVNHKYRFIFLKTRKTAGTSIEIALSRFCDDNDVITPITDEDENIRRELGFRGPQNYELTGGCERFTNHAGAQFVRENIGEKVWHSYYKFCFERDPFDKAISRYYWSTREPRPDIGAYLSSAAPELLSNWEIYTINDQVAVDFLGRYESLGEHLTDLRHTLGLPGEIVLPHAKASYRSNREHYSKVLNAQARARIESVCVKEIAAFGYRWTESD